MSRSKKADRLYEELLAQTQSMRCGMRFPSVREIMRERGLSQCSVKPAFDRLQQEGTLVSVVGSGTYVSKAGGKDLRMVTLLYPDWDSASIREMHAALHACFQAQGFRIKVQR